MTPNPLIRGFFKAMRLPDRRQPWEWCEEHLIVDDTSPMPGRWRSDNSPWVKGPMEAAAKAVVRRCVVKCSAQSAKTQTIMGIACWVVGEDPGPALWVMAAKDEARDFMRDRVMPTFRSCKPVWNQLINTEGLTFVFAGMPFYFTGAGSKSKLQSKPIRYLFLDEVRNYPNGALELALKRTRSFWNAKEFIISTPDMVNDDVDAEFKAGSQEHWHIRCPKCGTWQPLKFDNLKWETTDATKPEGKWHFDNLAETIRLQCVGCDHAWRDTPIERRKLAREGRYISANPNAPKHRVSFHWNALLPTWVRWRSVVEEFLGALKAAKSDPPELEPLKAFWNETLGESWEDALGVIDDYGFLEQRKGDYDFGDVWPEELARFMSADKQIEGGEHYWWVIRSFGPFGKSRLVSYGRANTYDELEELRKLHNVPLKNAMIDSGFRATEVYRFCDKSGWKAFKGDNTDLYVGHVPDENDPRRTKAVRRLWTKSEVEPTYGIQSAKLGKRRRGRKIALYRFSSDTVNDFLAEFMSGIVGEWTLTRNPGSEYHKQITSFRRVAVEDTKGRIHYEWRQVRKADHLRDCERMILVAAVISKLIQSGVVRASAEVERTTRPPS